MFDKESIAVLYTDKNADKAPVAIDELAEPMVAFSVESNDVEIKFSRTEKQEELDRFNDQVAKTTVWNLLK